MIRRGRRSLAGQLYVRVVLLTVVSAVAMALLLFAIVRSDVNDRADNQLATATRVLFLLMREEFDGDAVMPRWHRDRPNERLLSQEDIDAFQASANWRQFAVFHDGVMVVRPGLPEVAERFPEQAGFQDFMIAGATWRAFGLSIPAHRLLIVVAEPQRTRTVLLEQGAMRLALPIVGLILGSAGLLWLALRRGLIDIERLRATLASRSPQDLEHLDAKAWPLDLAGPIDAINRLFDRVREAFEREQALADQAAHQLRTPLAALKAQTQLLARRVGPDRRAEVDALLASVDRASEIVSQMLQLARLEATALTKAEVDLVDLAAGLIADRALVAARAGAEFALSHDAQVCAWTDRGCLSVALGALVDNAIAHAGQGGSIEIGVSRSGQGCTIVVCDRGPGSVFGLGRQQRQALARETGDASSGLGLPIVRRAMKILGSRLVFEDREGGGLIATIILPD